MSKAFDAWVGGAPVVAAGASGSDFGSWVSGAPVFGEFGLSSQILFVGEVVSVAVRGRVLSARVASGGMAFDRQVPRFRMGPVCNYAVFSPGCVLVREDWAFSATVAAPVSSAFPFVLHLESLARASGPAPDYFEGWFAGGYVEHGEERRAILDSTSPAAGALDLYLDGWWRGAVAAGNVVALLPGCDGRWQTCGAYNATSNPGGKFDNRLNFGGHPFVPTGNPSLVKVSRTLAGGKK